MRVNTVNQNPTAGGGFDITGATLTGPLILAADPTQPLEASTKKYIDNAVSSLSASHISTGTLPISRLPAFSGDFVSIAGTNVLTLTNTPVVVGNYTKVTVDTKGRVQSGGSLLLSDIPGFDWSKITNNKPTTIDGYGITDAVKNTTDSMTGVLMLHSTPTLANHAATKGYVDSLVSGSATLLTGDTIRRPNATTPAGFLRCNGGQVNKTTYAALYAVVGAPPVAPNRDGSGQPWRQQFKINTVQSNSINDWSIGTSLPVVAYASQVIVTKNRVYLLGGASTDNVNDSTVYTAAINTDGTLGTWVIGTPLPIGLSHSQAIVTKNRVYLLGGNQTDSWNISTSDIYTAVINTDGTLGLWTLSTPLPVALDSSQAIITNNRVYLLGGRTDGVLSSDVYTAPINTDGTLGTWVKDISLPNPTYFSQAVIVSNYVYLIGGLGSSNVYGAIINTDGTLGTWYTRTPLPGILGAPCSVVTKNRIYLLGGLNSGNALSASNIVYSATVSGTELGVWETHTSLPVATNGGQVIVTNNKIHILGGRNISTVMSGSFTGGLNDYSTYYSGSFINIDPSNFVLPDTTFTDPVNIYTFIKT